MNYQLIIKNSVRVLSVLYFIATLDTWVNFIFPAFYEKYFSKLMLYEIFNRSGIDMYIFFCAVCLIILHITHIFKIEKKVFWLMTILLLLNLLLVFLEVRRHGDS
jgi:hypothetical protein